MMKQKNEQAQNEVRIVQLESMLKNASIIDEEEVDTKVVNLGARVKIRDIKSKEDYDYQIVGSTEADPASNRISNESPVGSALLGHKVGDTVDIEVPGGKMKFKVIDIYK